MRVNELAKEIEKTNNEVNNTLQKQVEGKNPASGAAGEQAEKKEQAAKPAAENKAAENKEGTAAQPAKKRIAAVYRPQNSSQKGRSAGQGRPQGQRPARPAGAGMQVRPTTGTGTRPQGGKSQPAAGAAEKKQQAPAQAKPQATAAPVSKPQEMENQQVQAQQVQTQPAAGQTVQSAAAPEPRTSAPAAEKTAAASVPKTGAAAAPQTAKPQSSAPASQTARTSGQENQGSRDNRQGGYQGSRDNRQGGGRGMSIPKPSFDTPMAQKQQNTKASKNAYKKEHDAKRDRDEELKGKNGRGGKGMKAPVMQAPKKEEAKVEEIKTIVIPERITIKELAEKMKLQPSAIVKKLFLQGTVVTINQEVDFDKAEEIAMEYDVLCEKEKKVNVIEELLKEDEEDEKDMVPRPPVICVMGHVDHGKTSLLDAIRQTNVTAKEAGGITQHIGAYVVDYNGQKITFLDTPGHEAFTAMRMRGAQATDIAILVVAADDGVMPQTVEAINHAKAAGVEIIVAVNKIDKPSANVERVKQELSEYELIPEDWGGTTPFVPVSAKTGEGIDDLLEMILLTAEVSELKANPNRAARGLVIEAQLDKGKGPVATILVQKGTLHVGDFIAAGACNGKVRAMMDDKGRRVKQAGPSTPVEILGLGDVPNAGEVLMSFENDKEAKNFAAAFVSENKNRLLEETKGKLSLDNLFDQIQASDLKELPIIVKADVQGSVEAVKQSLVKLSNDEVVVRVIHGGVGAVNESDVSLAATSNAIIIGFNVRPDTTAKQLAEQEGVDLRLYRVIYQAIEDVEAAMKGMLDPVFEEKVIGHAEVRQLFKASGIGTIAGSYVLDGTFQRGCKVRITRDEEQIYEGELASLKRFKDDVKEVRAGYECGLVFQDFNDVKEEDKVEAYIMVEVPR